MRSRSGREEVGADGCPDSESSQTWQTSRTATEKKSATSLGTAQRTRRQLRAVPDEAEDPWRRLWGAKRRRSGCADSCAQTAATPAASLERQTVFWQARRRLRTRRQLRTDGRDTGGGLRTRGRRPTDEVDDARRMRRTAATPAASCGWLPADEANGAQMADGRGTDDDRRADRRRTRQEGRDGGRLPADEANGAQTADGRGTDDSGWRRQAADEAGEGRGGPRRRGEPRRRLGWRRTRQERIGEGRDGGGNRDGGWEESRTAEKKS